MPDGALVEIVRGRLEGLGPTTLAELARSTGLASERYRRGPDRARGRGLRPPRPFHARRDRGRVVRAPAAGPHPSADGQAAARRDRAGRRARFHALPPRLAAGDAGTADGRAGRRSIPSSPSSKASRRRRAPGRARSCLPASPATSRPGSTSAARPARSSGRGCARARPGRGGPRQGRAGADDADRTASRAAMRRSGSPSPQRGAEPVLSPKAQAVVDYIRENGASFFDELLDGTRLLRSQAEDALSELVAHGLVTSDSFGGLRALLVPSAERRPAPGGRRRTARPSSSAWKRPGAGPSPSALRRERRHSAEAIEHVAQTLLRRYGVVFWRLLEREAEWLPPWRDLLRVYPQARRPRRDSRRPLRRRLLRRAVRPARGGRRAPPDPPRGTASGALVSLSGADPLNLVGVLTPGARLPALPANRLLYRDGVPVAVLASGEMRFLETLDHRQRMGGAEGAAPRRRLASRRSRRRISARIRITGRRRCGSRSGERRRVSSGGEDEARSPGDEGGLAP